MNMLPKLGKRWKIIIGAVSLITVFVVLLPILLYESPDLPPATNVSTPVTPIADGDIRLFIDDTAWDPEKNRRVVRQEIFDEALAMIDRADQFVYVDLFLWNPWQGNIPEEHRGLSSELAEALIRKKRSLKKLDVVVLSDPINRIYGWDEPVFFKDIAKAGIPVVFTDLARLPDSNVLYSPYWTLAEKLLRTKILYKWANKRLFSNPFVRGGERISALQLGRMLMFKANHRKVIITGSTRHGLEMLVGSLNPADGSSAHSNMALALRGQPVLQALKEELAALRWSIERKRNVIVGATGMAAFKADNIERKAGETASFSDADPDSPTAQWLTEGAIAEAITGLLGEAGPGDEIRVAIFYLSERRVIESLKAAAKRGSSVKIVMDANRDAFGMRKIGIPNRPVAAELMKLSAERDVDIRWADTHGEQFHTKAMSICFKDTGRSVFTTGSANWTRRNIDNLNMEANLLIRDAPGITGEFNAYFDRIWQNTDSLSHTLPYSAWEEKGLKRFFKTIIYRFQERWGMGTF